MIFEIAFSFSIGIVSSVKKSYHHSSTHQHNPLRVEERTEAGTHHPTLRDIRHSALIHVVLVPLLDSDPDVPLPTRDQDRRVRRVHNGRQDIEQLIEIQARQILACLGRSVILGQVEEIVEFGDKGRVDPHQGFVVV